MAITARITLLHLSFDTRAFFEIDSFNVRPLDGKLLAVNVSELKLFDVTLPYEFRVWKEALCVEKAQGGNFAGFVV